MSLPPDFYDREIRALNQNMGQMPLFPTANDAQVGGNHYKDIQIECPNCGKHIQPWDFFGMMPYLVGCIFKYVLRYKEKNGLEDLKKARHYLDKLMEKVPDRLAPARKNYTLQPHVPGEI